MEQVFNVQAVRSQKKCDKLLATRYTRRQLSPWGNTTTKYFILFLGCQMQVHLAIFTKFDYQSLKRLAILVTLELSNSYAFSTPIKLLINRLAIIVTLKLARNN